MLDLSLVARDQLWMRTEVARAEAEEARAKAEASAAAAAPAQNQMPEPAAPAAPPDQTPADMSAAEMIRLPGRILEAVKPGHATY